MTSLVRPRRAEISSPFASHHHHHSPHHQPQHQRHLPITANAAARQNLAQNALNRSKRSRDTSDRDSDPKRLKFTIEIGPEKQQRPTKTVVTTTTRAEAPMANRPVPTVTGKKQKTKPSAAAAKPDPPANTKHQEKVINSIKHELKELQPSVADIKEQGGRKLRSQEATRFKSELSAYFPDYDEVIGNDPKEEHILNIDTPIVVVAGQHLSDPKGQTPPQTSARGQNYGPHPRDNCPVRGYSDSLFHDLCDSQVISFSFLESQDKSKAIDDPLPDAHFEPSHKKAERLERSIRNSEKGRAQHEKDQIVRLLGGLQGPDWLRVMGVSGITESRKKTFEPAREHFIKGCKAILEKFRNWSVEEKRRKAEKDRILAAEARAREKESSQDTEHEEETEGSETNGSSDVRQTEPTPRTSSDRSSSGDPPDNSDVDAHIEKQLRNDILMAHSIPEGKATRRRKLSQVRQTAPTPEPQPPREFTSFFEKKYQRDAALSKSRRRGRTVLAWGHSVPEPPEAEFDLPWDLRDPETLRVQARRKRRDRRGVKP